MSQIHQERRRADTAPPASAFETSVPGPHPGAGGGSAAQ